MSLIADALKAAQRERHGAYAAGRGSRQVIAASVLRHRGTARMSGASYRLPRSLGLATAVFAVALLVSVSVIAFSPERPRPIRSTPDAARAAVPTSARASAPAAPTSDPRLSTEPAQTPDDAPEAPLRLAPREVVESAEMAPPLATQPAPSSEPAPAAGRFQLTVEPAPAGADPLAEAVVAHRRGDYATAIELYQRTLAQSPRNAQALGALGSAYQANGQLTLARDAFRRALEVNVRDAAAWSGLGAVLSALGDAAEAQAALGEAVRLNPADQGAKVNLANHYLAHGLPLDARRLLQEVVRDQPTHAEAHYALGRALEMQSDRAGAASHYRAFLEHARGRFPQLEAPVRARIAQLGG